MMHILLSKELLLLLLLCHCNDVYIVVKGTITVIAANDEDNNIRDTKTRL